MKLREVLGKFVVLGEHGRHPPAPAGAAASSSPRHDKASPLPPAAPAPAAPQAAELDLADIYRQAEIASVSFTAEQALDMLSSLPKGLPVEMQRETLETMLRVMSAKMDTAPASVVEDARRKSDALLTAIANISGSVSDFVASTESEIADVERLLSEKRQAIEKARSEEQRLTLGIRRETERLSGLLRILGSERSSS